MANSNDSHITARVFISYSHKDEAYLHELEKHLTNLKRENLISTWHDRKITAGEEWDKRIDHSLSNSDIILFLISPDFIASDYCIENEVTKAISMHNNKEATLLPVIIRPCDWQSTPISKIQALPKDGKPLSLSANQDQCWLEITNSIRHVSKKLTSLSSTKRTIYFSINEALVNEINRIDDLYSREAEVSGIPTGLADLDHQLDGIHPGDLCIVASAPMMDRIGILISFANNILVRDSLDGLVFTLKHTKEEFVRHLCAAAGYMRVRNLARGMLAEDDWHRLTSALGLINDKNIAIVDTHEIDTQNLLLQIDNYIKINSKNPLVIIDSLEHISGENKHKTIETLSRYARAHKVPIIIFGGLETDPSSRSNKRPVLKDLGAWANINEHINIVLFLYQDERYNFDSLESGTAEIILAKNPRGPTSIIKAIYHVDQQIYSNFVTE